MGDAPVPRMLGGFDAAADGCKIVGVDEVRVGGIWIQGKRAFQHGRIGNQLDEAGPVVNRVR